MMTMKGYVKRNWIWMAASIVILALFIYFFSPLSNYFFEIEKGNSNSPHGELLKVFLTFVAGIVAIFVWHSGYKHVKVMEKGNVDARFNNAVGHLGSDKSIIALGGIHMLHQIAIENESYRQVVHNIFCSYLRENSLKIYMEKEKNEKEIGQISDKCPTIIQTLIDYLFRQYNGQNSIYENYESDLWYCTLKNVIFRNAVLTKCWLDKTTLDRCWFKGANLKDCSFSWSNLTGCSFTGANLTKCDFYESHLTSCSFGGANLMEFRSRRAIMTTCNFGGATLTNSVFNEASLDYSTKSTLSYHAKMDDYTKETLNNAEVVYGESSER